jgi:DNA-binding SARP family transcriptional activator/tetratricopeptide (TPR) repeat protein
VSGEAAEGLTRAGTRAVLELLGTPMLSVDGRPVPVPDKTYFLAAVLALSPTRQVARSKLRDLLWGAAGQAQANANLRQLLSRIVRVQRTYSISVIHVDGALIRLAAGETAVDLLEWLSANPLELARQREWDRLADLLVRHDKDLLEGIETGETSLDDWLTVERQRLRFGWVTAASALLDTGVSPPEVELAIATRAIARDNTSEPAYRAMMRAHARVGDLAAARRAYQACRAVLKAELGIEPTPETVVAADRLLGASVPAAPIPPPVTTSVRAPITGAAADRPRVAILAPARTPEKWVHSRAYALLEDVTVGLSRYRSFRIIAAHTSLMFATRMPEAMDGQRWCDFALFSSARVEGSDLKLALRLTETSTDEVIWAAEPRLPRDDLRQVHREITSRVVASTADAVDRAQLALPSTPDDPSAYRLFLEGRRCLRSTDLRDLRRARRIFRDSSRLDPGFAATYAGLSRTLSLEWLVRGAPNPDLLEEASTLAATAVVHDPEDARGHREAGFAALYAKRHDESLGHFQRAVDLNPNDCDLLADYADALAHAGDPDAGLEAATRALSLNPYPPAYYHWMRGGILYQMGRYAEALDALSPVNENPATARLLAACSARVGDRHGAGRFARTVRETFPDFRTDQLWTIIPNRNPQDTRNLIDGLRAAGLP